MTINAVTNTATGQLLRIGSSDFENDGTFDAGTETYHAGIVKDITLLTAVLLKYIKLVAGVMTEMTQGEKDAVDAVPEDPLTNYHALQYPTGAVETLSASGVISLLAYTSVIDASSLNLTLADGNVPFQGKRIQTQTGSCNVVCTLDGFADFDLGNNNKAELMWYEHSSGNHWVIIDSKGITLNV